MPLTSGQAHDLNRRAIEHSVSCRAHPARATSPTAEHTPRAHIVNASQTVVGRGQAEDVSSTGLDAHDERFLFLDERHAEID
jgi:hypothetical protein